MLAGQWVVLKSEEYLWTVGFYDPSGKWIPHEDLGSKEEAQKRCHYLNGGNSGAITRAREGFRIPEGAMIYRTQKTKRLYAAEEKRNESIKKAASELSALLGFSEGQFYTHTMPEELLNILESFEIEAGRLAAEVFLENHPRSE